MLKLFSIKKMTKKIKYFFLRKKYFPSNVIITASHGSYKIPISVFSKLSLEYQMSPRLLLNFSDYGTSYLVKEVPEKQKIIPRYGRLVGDPNRDKKSSDIIRFYDFGGNPIFSRKFEKRITTSWFHTFWLHKILKLSYKPFYDDVLKKIETTVQDPKNKGKPIILIDIHDTGNLLLGAKKSQDRLRKENRKMPQIIIANAPDEQTGENCFGTAPEYIMDFLQESFCEKCDFPRKDVKINHLFYGGHVTRFLGNPWKQRRVRKVLHGHPIYTIQIEFNRGLYMHESTQKPRRAEIKKIRNALMETIYELEDVIIPIEE